jgi:hypothetical protein
VFVSFGSRADKVIEKSFIHLKTKTNAINIYKFSPCCTVNSPGPCYKHHPINVLQEKIAVFSEIHIEHITAARGQNAELFKIKPGGITSNHQAIRNNGSVFVSAVYA